jgi:hypothetical protein
MSKIKVTVTFADAWVPGGSSISEIRVRAIQNGSEVNTSVAPYNAGQPVEANFGAELPNGDTTFIARAYDANGAPVGGEQSVSMNVNKALIAVPSGVTAQ